MIGGLILNSVSWRWIFYVNVPVGALGLALAWKLLPGDAGRADAGRLDWKGLLLLSPGLAGVVFGLSETETHGGIGAPIAVGPILAGIVLVVLFVLHALRAERPLIDVRLCTIATLPFAWVGAHTSYAWLAAILVVRGMGFGSAMMPSMAAAYATLDRAAVPRATSALNVLQRVGGSVGTAFLAVVLQGRIKANLRLPGGGAGAVRELPPAVRQRVAEPLAHAFAQTFWWAVALIASAMIPAGILAVLSRPGRERGVAGAVPA